MSAENRLNAEKEEWLVRAAIGPRSSFIPADIVEALVGAGFAEKNVRGELDVNAAGRAYIAEMNLPTRSGKRGQLYDKR